MSMAGKDVYFEVLKGAAFCNGLDSWLQSDINNDRLSQKNVSLNNSSNNAVKINGNPPTYNSYNSVNNQNYLISELYSQVNIF